MKKLYSIVLMATALLIGTNVWADNEIQLKKPNGSTAMYSRLNLAFRAAADGDTIKLLTDYTMPAKTKTTEADTVLFGKDGTSRSITFDFAGKTLTSPSSYPFALYKGTLRLKNSVPGEGGLIVTNTYGIGVYGTYLKGINSRTAAENELFTHLIIEKDVNINATNNGTGIIVLPCRATESTDNKGAMIYHDSYNATTKKWDSDPRGVANGVRVDIYGDIYGAKYAVQVNGQLACANPKYMDYYRDHYNDFYDDDITGLSDDELLEKAMADTAYSPYIYVDTDANLSAIATASTGIAAYSSGYARWYIKGTCEGANGLYMKSGAITLDGATIKSTTPEGTDAQLQPGATKGVTSLGNAIVVESNSHYSGNTILNVLPETTVSTEADGGIALAEIIAPSDESSIKEINISGGDFTGETAIIVSSGETLPELQKVTIEGATLNGQVSVTSGDITSILNGGAHATTINNADGTTTIIVSEGAAPTAANTGSWNTIKDKEGQNVKWNVAEPASIAKNDTVTLGELQIISGSAGNLQQLTIANGAALIVDKLIMNDYARIIVEAGGELRVVGTMGINAPVVENIVLKSTSNAHAIFLFHPEVLDNRHPNATVEFLSKSFRASATDYQWERFGIPTWNALKSIESDITGLYTDIYVFENNDWQNLGQLQTGVPFANIARMNKPFATYNLLAYKGTAGATYTLKGELVGNTNAELNTDREWNSFANSYAADIDIEALLVGVNNAERIDPTVYYAKPQGLGHYSWEAYDIEWLDGEAKISPMEVFLLRNNSSEPESSTLNYASMVYAPAVPGYTPSQQAPRRFAKANDNTARLRVIVANEEGVQDNVKMTEKTSNLHNAVKYMNDDLNIYAMADEKAAIVAAEDLENTYVGFSTVKGGNFTISFANVEGREFTLVDHATGARVEIAEGNTYEFTADANSANDYRFEIVGRANMPTAIDNTEAVKSAKGVYTITGQYVGEMNVWNTLPAGVYVVNGEKRVK